MKPRIQSIAGLAGVAADERETARRWGRRFELPMIMLALWILIEWYAQVNGMLPPAFSAATDWLIWLFFFTETTLLTTLVKDKRRYLRGNWVNLTIIVLGMPVLSGIGEYVGVVRSLRLLLMLTLLFNVSETVREVLSRNNLGVTLFIALVFIIFSGIFIAGIDPGITSLWEGIWWSWVTVTTVGYGDIVPTSVAGKVFGAFLILLGIGLFSLLTASFSAFFVAKDERDVRRTEHRTLTLLAQIEARLANLERQLAQNEKENPAAAADEQET
jgi:voltage-gated potassium channel